MIIDLMQEQLYYDENRGFITESVHGEIPDHAVSITREEHKYLLTEVNVNNKEMYVVDGVIKLKDIVYSRDKIAAMVRNERDIKLKGTDWTQLPDAPDALAKKYKTYRQELRNVTDQEGFPFDIVWPTLK